MVALIVISIITAICAGISRAVSNKMLFHYRNSIFKLNDWYNPEKSWRNKWKLNHDRTLMTDAYGKYIERFKFSSTLLVMFTDAWHLFEFIFRICFATSFICIALLTNYSKWFNFGYVIVYLIFTFTFHIFFTKIFHRQTRA